MVGWMKGPVVGRGSTATVSLGLFSNTGEVFAVKSAEASKSGSLMREQRLLSQLDSPHVVSYRGFEVTADKKQYNLLMEYAEKGSVWDEIKKRGGLEEWRVRRYARGMVEGLRYLHGVGIAHCDLKARNVLVGAEGEVKLADFGCARSVREDNSIGFGGTPAFVAPEVARGQTQGTEADVWALGCTVIEMATGRLPWSWSDDPVSLLHRIAFSEDTPAVGLGCLSDDGIDFVENCCLKRNPEERWTAEQLLQHPFLHNMEMEVDHDDDKSQNVWRSSPKCVLDRDDFTWDSSTSMDRQNYHEFTNDACLSAAAVSTDFLFSDPADRIRELGSAAADHFSCSTSTNWDDQSHHNHSCCWIDVRSATSVSTLSPPASDGGCCDSCFTCQHMNHVGDDCLNLKINNHVYSCLYFSSCDGNLRTQASPGRHTLWCCMAHLWFPASHVSLLMEQCMSVIFPNCNLIVKLHRLSRLMKLTHHLSRSISRAKASLLVKIFVFL